MDGLFESLEASALARLIAESLMLTASLSALHLIGFTLVMGSALVANLRLLGVLLRPLPVTDVTNPAARGIVVGLSISMVTGLLLFSPRAVSASANGIFQLKMLLLVSAGTFFVLQRRITTRQAGAPVWPVLGAAGLLLWLGVALAGCAFILLE